MSKYPKFNGNDDTYNNPTKDKPAVVYFLSANKPASTCVILAQGQAID